MLRFLARALGGFAWRRPGWVLLCWVALVVASTVALPRIVVDPTLEGLLGHEAPSNRATAHLKALFGNDETIVVAVAAPNVLDPAVLERLFALRTDLLTVPHVVSVQSVVDAPQMRVVGDRVQLGGALLPWPAASELPDRIRLLEDSVYEGLMIDAEHTVLAVILTLPPPPAGELVTPPWMASASMDATQAILHRHAHPSWELYATGKVGIADALGRTLGRDLLRYGFGATVFSGLLLGWRFRRVSSVLLPLFVTVLPVLGTLGAMAVFGVPLQLPSAVLPPLVVVISVAGVVHLVSDLDQRLERVPWGAEAVLASLEDKIEALTLAAATTVIGMLSLSFSPIGPAAVVGRFGTLAAILGLFCTLLLVPAWCRLFPWERPRTGTAESTVLIAIHAQVRRFRVPIVVASMAAFLVSLAVASQLHFSHDPVRWMPASWEVRQGAAVLDEKLHVLMDLDVVIDTRAVDGAFDPAWIGRLRRLQEGVRQVHHGPVHSLVDHLDDVHAVLGSEVDYGAGDAGVRSLDRDLRLLRLFGDDTIATQVTRDGRHLRLMVRTDAADAVTFGPLIEQVQKAVDREIGAESASLAGLLPVFHATVVALGHSAAVAWPLVVLGGAGLLVATARSMSLGVLLLLPNLLPATLALGGLWLVDLPLDLFTLLTISLALGIVLDDCIHLVTCFRQHLQRGLEPDRASEASLASAGPAMVLTTALLVGGWLTLLLSPLPGLWMFALVSSGTLAFGLLADLVITPAVLMTWAGHVR